MPFEIEMFAVGNADSIMIRYFDFSGSEYVVLIDAGHKSSGKKIRDAIKKYTISNEIDLAICTHPDDDHIGGFFDIIGHVKIKKFWIHDPSQHKINTQRLEKIITENDQFEKGLKYVLESLTDSNNLLALIDKYKIKREEPFAGLIHDDIPIKVVGPSESYYDEKLECFRDAYLLVQEEADLKLSKSLEPLPLLSEFFVEAELSDRQLLDKKNDRSNENNSSVILLFETDNKRILFTADTGPEALMKAHKEYDLTDIDILDVPHHGSRYNLTSELIDIMAPKAALISCGLSLKYPSEYVVKVLKEIGCTVYATNDDRNILYSQGIESRDGYSDAEPL